MTKTCQQNRSQHDFVFNLLAINLIFVTFVSRNVVSRDGCWNDVTVVDFQVIGYFDSAGIGREYYEQLFIIDFKNKITSKLSDVTFKPTPFFSNNKIWNPSRDENDFTSNCDYSTILSWDFPRDAIVRSMAKETS